MARGWVEVASGLCKGCELCVAACPPGCLAPSETTNALGYRVIALVGEGCTGCAACALVCPDAALTVYRRASAPRAA